MPDPDTTVGMVEAADPAVNGDRSHPSLTVPFRPLQFRTFAIANDVVMSFDVIGPM